MYMRTSYSTYMYMYMYTYMYNVHVIIIAKAMKKEWSFTKYQSYREGPFFKNVDFGGEAHMHMT